MPTIVLVRHGPVAREASGLLSFADFCRHIDAYERSGVAAGATPPEEVARLVNGARTIFASDAPRVRDTLARFGVAAAVTDGDFREAPPLAPRLPGRWPEIFWLALARGRGEFDPALAGAREDLRRRAAACCDRLLASAGAGDVALVGHGWFNRYVGKALAGRGWRKAGGPGFGRPWGHAIYVRASDAG